MAKKTILKYGIINLDHYDDCMIESCMLSDIMFAHGYEISNEDAYLAWLAGSDGVWEHPMDYTDYEVVKDIVSACREYGVIDYAEEDTLSLSDDDWNDLINQIEGAIEDYEPQQRASIEGAEWEIRDTETDRPWTPSKKTIN